MDMYVTQEPGGLLELRQTRFKALRYTRGGEGHPHDVCAVARTREEMQGIVDAYFTGPIAWEIDA